MAFGFLSLAFTLAVLAATVIGADKVSRGAHEAWARAREISAHSLSLLAPTRRSSGHNIRVGVVPVSDDEAVGNQDAVDEGLVA